MVHQLGAEETTTANHEDLESIRRRLQSRNETVRKEAEGELGGLQPGDLIKLMAIEQERRRSRRTWFAIGVSIYLLLAVTFVVLWHSGGMFTTIGSFTGVIAAAAAFSPAHKNAARALAKYEDVAGVGPLLETLQIPDKDVQSAVRTGLTGILPRLRASDARLLNPNQRKILRAQMGLGLHSKAASEVRPFIESALRAMEQVGDESFLEPVERLAHGEGYGAIDEVRAAAERCIPALKQKIDNDRMSHDLLRAASANAVLDSDELLRASHSTGHTEPEQLLRAVNEP